MLFLLALLAYLAFPRLPGCFALLAYLDLLARLTCEGRASSSVSVSTFPEEEGRRTDRFSVVVYFGLVAVLCLRLLFSAAKILFGAYTLRPPGPGNRPLSGCVRCHHTLLILMFPARLAEADPSGLFSPPN